MKTIWKYPLTKDHWRSVSKGIFGIQAPKGSKPLCIKMKKEGGVGGEVLPVLWFEVDPKADLVEIRIQHVETGGSVPDNARYIGTCFSGADDSYVSHFYWLPTCSTGLMSQ